METMHFRASAVAVAIIVGAIAPAAAQQPTLTFAGFGGNLQADFSKTLLTPAAEKAGVTLREHTQDGLAGVRVQVQSGSPGWDIVHLGSEDCASGAREQAIQVGWLVSHPGIGPLRGGPRNKLPARMVSSSSRAGCVQR